MTVASENNRNQYNCNGFQLVFPYTFRILDESHLTVVLADSGGNETELTLNTDYTVSGVGDAAGGNVTTVSTYASGYTLTIVRDVPTTQETDYVENDPFPAQSHEDALDKLTMLIQQIKEEIARCPALATSSGLSNLLLPVAASRAIGWNSDGDGLTTYATESVIDPAWDSIRNHGNSLAQMVSDIGPGKATVLIDVSPNTLTADLTIPSNIGLKCLNGITIDGSYTLTINGPFEGSDGCFGSSITVVFGAGAVTEAYPDWWKMNESPGTTDMGDAIRSAIFSGAPKIKLFNTTYYTTSRIIDAEEPPEGFTLAGSSQSGNDDATTGTVIKYSGSQICFDIVTATGSAAEVGRWIFKNITFHATNISGGMFEFNDISITPDDSPSTAKFITEIKFENCKLWGEGSTSVTGNAIQAVKTFELVVDDNCYFRGWKRAVYLKGSDNCTIGGRFSGNGRHIHAERSGTFGNGLEIRARFLGPCLQSVAEDNYQIYMGSGGIIYSPWIEGYTDGSIYFDNAYPVVVIKPYFASLGSSPHNIAIKVSPSAQEIVVINPVYVGSGNTVDISDPDTWEWLGSNNLPHTITFVRPSARFVSNLLGDESKNPRVRVIDAEYSIPDLTHGEGVTVNSHGVKRKKRYALTPFNIEDARSTSIGWAAIDGVVDDSGAYGGKAIALSTTSLSGISRQLVVGTDVNEGDTINLSYYYRLESAKTAGTFRYVILKNGVNVTNGEIGSSTTYSVYNKSYTLSGFSDGDYLQVGVYQSGLDVRAFLASLEIEVYDTSSVSTGTGTVKMGSANAADNTGWMEVSPGKWVPYWNDPTP